MEIVNAVGWLVGVRVIFTGFPFVSIRLQLPHTYAASSLRLLNPFERSEGEGHDSTSSEFSAIEIVSRIGWGHFQLCLFTHASALQFNDRTQVFRGT